MVPGLNRFREHFAGHEAHYAVIGGSACSLIFEEAGLDFRATQDIDMVLCVEVIDAAELGRRLTTKHGPSVGVHWLCPGPVDSSIARNAPDFLKPVVGPMMHRFFRSPAEAVGPVIYLSAAPELAGDTGWYMHLMRHKEPDARCLVPEDGKVVWEKGEKLIANWL